MHRNCTELQQLTINRSEQLLTLFNFLNNYSQNDKKIRSISIIVCTLIILLMHDKYYIITHEVVKT